MMLTRQAPKKLLATVLTGALLALAPQVAAQEEEDVSTHIPAGYELVTPSAERTIAFTEAAQSLEPGADYLAVMRTTAGNMLIELYADQTPITVNNFVFLALNRYYDGIVFHRVLEDFMAQGGDPTGTGMGGPGYEFVDEFVPSLRHTEPGILSMANAGPGTNGSQFFITFRDTPHLDDRHTVFGKVISGLGVLDEITRIDPGQPSNIVRLTDTLGEAAANDVELAGDDSLTLEQYLTSTLGELPSRGQTFEVDGLKGMVGTTRGGDVVAGFWPSPDHIETVEIYMRRVAE